jgi:2'-5' RNA ligase
VPALKVLLNFWVPIFIGMENNMSIIRAFIAIELPPELKKELAVLEAQLRKNSPPVIKWVDPQTMHITLKFLGDTSDSIIDDLMLALKEAVKGAAPFKLEIHGVGSFSGPDRTETIWVGVSGEMEKLAALQKNIESNTELLGYKREKRLFSPHLTLGRVRDEAGSSDCRRIGKLITETTFTALHNVDVTAVNLLKSQLTPAGAIHTVIGTAKLG